MVFKGYLTGDAERYFWKKQKETVIRVFVIGMLFLSPVFIITTIFSKSVLPLLVFSLAFPVGLFIFLFPKTKKEKQKALPKLIKIKKESLTSISDEHTETCFLEDVKYVYDHDDFYEIIFSMSKPNYYFICQKSLIAKGTIEEFEELFESKIIRKKRD